MRKAILFFGLLFPMIAAFAGVPSCKTEMVNGWPWDLCERNDTNCVSLTKEFMADPIESWNACHWPALIYIERSVVPVINVLGYSVHVSLVPSYKDSERIDIEVNIEKPDGSHETRRKSGVPIIINKSGIPVASADFGLTYEPRGVPTVEAAERGGKREAAHSYK